VTAFLRLSDIEPTDVQRVGGKALQLGRLARKRLPVPAAFVVTTDGMHQMLRHNGLLPLAERLSRQPTDADAKRMREELAAAELPPGWHDQLARHLRKLGPRVAVRSSGIDEDGKGKSYAGVFVSVLDVQHDQVANALRTCWQSLYAEPALAYRAGRGPTPGSMAVLIQRMVKPRCSGVLFTVNPLTGSWREMVVEATWGLGEGLMAGQVTPHWFLVRRPRKAPAPVQRLLSRVRLQLMQEDLPEITNQWVLRDDGTTGPEPLQTELIGTRTLERSQLFRLCRLGLRVEGEIGEPQDVEWAMDEAGQLHLLQARPITSTGTPRVRDDVLWTRRFIGERWNQPATPLGWSLVAPILEWFVAYPRTQARYLGGGPAFRLVASRPFFNVTVFRHLAFKLPGAPPPTFMLEFLPTEEAWAWRRRFAVMPGLAVYLSIFRETAMERRWQRFRWNPLTNHTRWDEFEQRMERELPGLSRPPMSQADAVRLVVAQRELLRGYIEVHITSLLFANLFYQLLEGALANWLPEHAMRLMEALAVCPPGNRTLAANEALYELAAVATDEDLQKLEQDGEPGLTVFWQRLGEFLAKFGHRADASWEVFSPRWAEKPALLVPLLKAARKTTLAPGDRSVEQEELFTAAEAEVKRRLKGESLRRWTIAGLVHYTRRYLLLRENQRFQFDRLLHSMHRTLHWLGGRLTEDGHLATADDVQLLTWDEVCGLVDGTLPAGPVPALVERRRAERAVDLATDPPVFLRGDEGVVMDESGSRLQGLGISPGRHRGIARVLDGIDQGDQLLPGEILVTRSVDPAWTPLFLTAGAVVLEMGSRLSHGAVVAREYKVPAVVNIDGVMRRIRTGQEITVDGNRGVVWIHG